MSQQEEKTYDTLLTAVPQLQALDKVVHKFTVDPKHGRQMFSLCIKNSIQAELLTKIQFVQSNEFLKQEQQSNYVEFAKKRIYTPSNVKEI